MSRAEFVDELYYALDGFDAHSIPGHDIAEKRILAAHDAAVAEAVGEAIVPLGEWLEPCVYCSGQRTSGSCRCEPCRGTGWRVRPSVFDAAVAEAVAAVKADIDANWPGASLPRAIAEQTAGYLGGLTACAVVVKQAFARAVLAGDGE